VPSSDPEFFAVGMCLAAVAGFGVFISVRAAIAAIWDV
jgi:hypothetical protein